MILHRKVHFIRFSIENLLKFRFQNYIIKLGICILYGFLINRTEKKKGKKTLIFLPFRYVDL